MGLQLTCPRGHRWESAANGSRDTHPLCPQCGAAPLASLAPAPSRAGPPATFASTLAPPAAVPAIPSIAGYRILGELGRGGMGVVYKAQHVALKRIVALKMVLSGAHAGSVEVARFRAEAEAVARLQHPNIVQIYEVGEYNGQPYCALEYVAGGSLAQRIAGQPLPPAMTASLIAALAEGVQHAHDHGIVHRDLKPANVLLQESDVGKTHSGNSTIHNSTRNGHFEIPKITDFGLAKTLDNPDGPTKTGSVLGTPSYMAPEQALGKNRTIGPPTDIYALGAILYECLTGKPPFKAETSLDTMLMVASQDPVPPRQINRAVPRDLETICLKCLRKEPGKRYPSARELADDLGRFLRNEPILARPVGLMERAVKWATRRPAWTVAALLLLALPLVTGAIVWKWRQGDSPSSAPPPVIDANEQMRYAQQIIQADQERLEGKFNHADEILGEVAPEIRGWEWDYLHRICYWGLTGTMTDFGGPIRQVAFGRKGRLAVVTDSPGVQLRDVLSGKSLGKIGEQRGPANAVAFSSDGKNIAAAGNDRMLRLYDAVSGQEIAAREHPGPLACVAFSPDGKWLAAGGGPPNQPGFVWLWNAVPGKEPVRKCGFHKNRVISVSFSADSLWFSSMAHGGEMHGWGVAGGDGSYTGTEYAQRLIAVPRSPAVGILSYRGLDIWSVAQQTKTSFLDPPTRNPAALKIGNVGMQQEFDDQPDPRPGSMVFDGAYNADETMLALSGGWNSQGKVRIYRGGQMNGSLLLFGHKERIGTIAFAPDQPLLATGSADGTVRIWDPTVRRFDAPLAAAAPAILSGGPVGLTNRSPMAFSPDSQRLATVTPQPLTLALWDLKTGRHTICQPLTDKGVLQAPYFSPDGRLAAVTGEGTRTVCVWNGTTGAKIGAWSDHPVTGGELSVRPEGFLMASSFPDRPVPGFLDKPEKGIRLIDPTNGAKLRTFGPESFWLFFPVLSPNGDRLAAVSREGVLHLWDTTNGKVLLKASGRDSPRFTADGRYLIRTAPKKPVEIWDARTGQQADLHLPSKPLTGPFQFAPDGKLLAWAVEKNEILLWNAATGQPVATIRGHGGPVGSMVFSNDGRRLFSVGSEGATVKIWDTATGVEMASLHHAKGSQGHLLLSPDGRKLALRNTGGTFVWDATPLSPEATGAKP